MHLQKVSTKVSCREICWPGKNNDASQKQTSFPFYALECMDYSEERWHNSLPHDKILDVIKFKAFADNKINVVHMENSVFDRVGNRVGKGENAGCQYFLFFPQCFQKASFLGSLKVRIVW